MDSIEFSPSIWRTSRRSASVHCVEVAETPSVIGVRDSKNKTGHVLRIPVSPWTAFLGGVKRGEFDRP